MPTQTSAGDPDYALGYTDAEHERLLHQAALLAPITEGLFRSAGITSGQRVLDLGSGLGDVSMLAARIVGPSGVVVGVERDANSIAHARLRVSQAGLKNGSFTRNDVNEIDGEQTFDAVEGRFILMFLPDPVRVMRSAFRLLRHGGVFAFQEAFWIPMLAVAARLPLWFKMLSAIHQTLWRCGANPEMGMELSQLFQQVGMPPASMMMVMPMGVDTHLTSVMLDLLTSLRPAAGQHGVDLAELGDLDTLDCRVRAEIESSGTVVGVVPLMGAWSRKP